ncbi:MULTISPECIES: hypothetical protein [Nitrosopumilus]|uniref:Uncharacterized protein n=1 Tax=Nitrosopumilus piranensis TaxID=1582439 RepID=A0A0C5BW85_9ARCH|nr:MULTISPECIES: hypothetical protein [Nitrosopumilus]AJM92499.1 hypothetical protein NPIRD3C_1287 [Nitrosopumilus piranensis]KAF6244395.1 hypothetical protein C6989_08960 [Nitrosopumilus sp. b2]
MVETSGDSFEHDLFVTEFPKQGYGIVDYLQGRVHFALLDQMKLMHTSGMTQEKIKETILMRVTEIIENFEPNSDSKGS